MTTGIAGVAALAWLYLLFVHHGFWRADQRLPKDMPAPHTLPSVIAVVPARNEAPSIQQCVVSLAVQKYAGAFSVVVVDDGSTDGTADLARAASSSRVTVITAPPLEAGWTGKLGALQAGLLHLTATGQSPDYLWFTDADIVHPPETLTQLMTKAVTERRDLVSLMARLRCVSPWERLLIPAFIFFFQMLYPFRAVNDDRSSMAAAAGGCVVVKRDTLMTVGGLAAIRGRMIDDCALAQVVKRAGGRIWLGLSDGTYSLRQADGLAPLWAMVRRTAFTQLHHSNILLLLTILALAVIFLAPPLLALGWPVHGNGMAAGLGLAAWGAMTVAYAPTLKDYGLSPWAGLLLPVTATLYGAMTFDSGVAHWRQRGGQWKGRYYNPSAAAPNLPESP